MKTRYLALLATLAFLGFSVPAAAHDCPPGNPNHKHCVSAPAPSEGGKALLFIIADAVTCVPAVIEPGAASFGQVTWAGNVLWDPINIHAHFKLQLKDVDPGLYFIQGNNGIECTNAPADYPICESDEVEPCVAKSITVKQNGQGRTSGALRLPGCKPDDPTTVWVTVTVTINGETKILRSTPVTIVLPPNEVGTGQSCLQ